MSINLQVIQDLIKSYNAYKKELSRQLNLDEIRKLEEEQRAKEIAAKAAAQPKGTGTAR